MYQDNVFACTTVGCVQPNFATTRFCKTRLYLHVAKQSFAFQRLCTAKHSFCKALLCIKNHRNAKLRLATCTQNNVFISLVISHPDRGRFFRDVSAVKQILPPAPVWITQVTGYSKDARVLPSTFRYSASSRRIQFHLAHPQDSGEVVMPFMRV